MIKPEHLVSASILGLAVVVAAVPTAWAGAKAHLQCSLDGGAVIKKGAKVGLDKDVWCMIVWDGKGTPPDGATAKVSLTEQRADGPHASADIAADLVGEDAMTYWQPQAAFAHGTDFASCGGFTVKGVVTAGDGEVWSGTTAIGVKCPKPKKLNAAIACFMEQGDTMIKWPGNGPKLKARLESELDCRLDSKTEPTDGTKASFVISHDDGSKTDPKVTDSRQYPGDQTLYGFEESFTQDEYQPCSNFTLTVTAVDATGQTVWTGKMKIAQDCPD